MRLSTLRLSWGIFLIILTALSSAFAEDTIAGGYEIRIGLMAGLSGPSANVGRDCRRGYELARGVMVQKGRIKDYRLRFLYADHRADPKTGLSEFNRLVDIERVHAVVTHRSPVALAINPVSRRKNIPILLITGHPELRVRNSHAFEFWPLVSDEGEALARVLAGLGKTRVAVLTTEDEWTLGLRDIFVAELEKLAGQLVYDQAVPKDETDFAAYALQIKKGRPTAVFVNLRPGQVGAAVRRLREAGINEQIIGNFYMRKSEEIDIAGVSAMEGAIIVEPNFSGPEFVNNAQRVLGDQDITGVTYTCYSAIALLVQALEADPNIREPKDLSATLAGTAQVRLPDEIIRMVERAARYNLAYRTIKKGKVIALEFPSQEGL